MGKNKVHKRYKVLPFVNERRRTKNVCVYASLLQKSGCQDKPPTHKNGGLWGEGREQWGKDHGVGSETDSLGVIDFI